MTKPRQFTNANLEPVEYDGSEITWRISVYALIIKDQKLLIAKSKHEKLYDVIGGGVDINEEIEGALEREALEEAGAKIKIGKLLFTESDWFYHRQGTFHRTHQLYYSAELLDELEQPTDPNIEEVIFAPLTKIGTGYRISVTPSVAEKIKLFA